MISVLVSITALQQRLITLRGGRPHRRWMWGGGEGEKKGGEVAEAMGEGRDLNTGEALPVEWVSGWSVSSTGGVAGGGLREGASVTEGKNPTET